VSATTLPVIGTLLAAVPDPAGPGQQLALLSQQVLGAAAQLSMHRAQTCELTAVGYLRQHNATCRIGSTRAGHSPCGP
jgi:hypothetical protein